MAHARDTTTSDDRSQWSTPAEPPSEAAGIDLGSAGDEDAAPVPPAQVAASCEAMEKGSKLALIDDDDAPVPPSHVAAALEKRGKVVPRKLEVIDDDGAPLPPTAHVFDQLRGRDAALRRKCEAVPPPSRTAGPRAPPPVAGAERMAPLPTPRIRQGGLRTEAALPTNGDSAGPSPTIELEAQLVQHVQDATLIIPGNDELVHGVRVQHVPWYRKRNTFVFGSLGLLVGVGVAVAIALTVGAKDPVVELLSVPATAAPSVSSAPSPAPSLQPTFQLGALDLVNEVLSNVTIPFADGDVTGPLGLKAEFTEVGCRDLGVEEVKFAHSIQNRTTQTVRMFASGVQMLCSFRWSTNFFRASGTFEGLIEPTSSMETDVHFFSDDFDVYPPNDVDFSNCVTNFQIDADINDDGNGLVGALLEIGFDVLLRGELEKNAREYFCGILRKVDNETGLFDDMLALVSDTIDTVLDGDLPQGADPLLAEMNAQVPVDANGDPVWVNLLELDELAQESLETDVNLVMGRVLGSASFVSPEPEGENEGEGGYKITPESLSNDTDAYASFISNFGLSASVTSISVAWPDSIKEMKVHDPVGTYTLQNTVELMDLPVVVGMEMAMQPQVENDLYFAETFYVTANVTDAVIDFALFLGTNAQTNWNGTLGPVFYHTNNPPCISSAVDEIKLSVLSVEVSSIAPLTFGGFLDPGLEDIVSAAGDAMFHMYEQSLLEALPGYLGTTLQVLMDDFVDDAFNKSVACPHSSLFGEEDRQALPEEASPASRRTIFGSGFLLVVFLCIMV